MRLLLVCFVAMFALICAVPVQATFLDGETVRLTYELPNKGKIYTVNGINRWDFVVGPGVEVPLFPTYPQLTNVDFSDSNIFVTFVPATEYFTFYPYDFNGFHVFDLNRSIPEFSSVLINPATNMVGFDLSRITFDADNIYVNWAGLGYDNTTIVSLDIIDSPDASEALPEPSTILLLGSGLIGLAGYGRKRLLKK